jgi:Ni,Fe-hydrogenase III large subunit
MSAPVLLSTPSELPATEFFGEVRRQLAGSARLVSFFGRPAEESSSEIVVTALFETQDGLDARRTRLVTAEGFHSLSRDFPALNIFERELHEQLGVTPHDHPWLKPVRFPTERAEKMSEYPFYKVSGKEVHEVAVGPIHAGVIEPGHFRFMCLGEGVHHLEIQLGYQHRGVERLLLERAPFSLTPLVETIVGDTSVAHAWAYCGALEALAEIEVTPVIDLLRGVALELERIAMHLAGLAGMCADIAFQQGASTYGRLRTTAINTSMALCGSRFGRGWIRPGGLRMNIEDDRLRALRANLELIAHDIAIINDHFLNARSVAHRLVETGVVPTKQALELGLVGMAARASGVAIDVRTSLPGPLYERHAISSIVELGGDCWARALVRIREIDESLRWLTSVQGEVRSLESARAQPAGLRPRTLAIAVREGWRGEVVHAIETDAAGQLLHYKVQDPSLRNWMGLALAMRKNEISDFPICNKSFDLSYCGNDL